MLTVFNRELPVILTTDAGPFGLGAVHSYLAREQENPIDYLLHINRGSTPVNSVEVEINVEETEYNSTLIL